MGPPWLNPIFTPPPTEHGERGADLKDTGFARQGSAGKSADQGPANGDGNGGEQIPHGSNGSTHKRSPDEASKEEEPHFSKRSRSSLNSVGMDLAAIEKLESELKTTKSQLQASNSAYQSLMVRLENSKAEAEHWKQRAQFFSSKYSDLNRAAPVPAADLEAVVSNSGELRERVFEWVTNHLGFQGDSVPEEVEKVLEKVSGMPSRESTTAKSRATMFFQIIVWRFLCIELLDTSLKLQTKNDESGQVLPGIQREGGPDPRGEQTEILALKTQLLKLVAPFVAKPNMDNIQTRIVPGLHVIFEKAMELARHMNRRADRFELVGDGSQGYDLTWVCRREANLRDQNAVNYLITPVLADATKPKGHHV
ncbi:hypothetical protein GGR53DRAFT_36474 [Hypoxylon sp. FL1150]|nr:hypothetical protein GGR53DRAFT_36474 [Hypoxylon sp. FL1150]